jgi:hypothetical protein
MYWLIKRHIVGRLEPLQFGLDRVRARRDRRRRVFAVAVGDELFVRREIMLLFEQSECRLETLVDALQSLQTRQSDVRSHGKRTGSVYVC